MAKRSFRGENVGWQKGCLVVRLAHGANPDIPGGYWQEGNPDARAERKQVSSLAEAARACRRYIEENGLGGGNWAGGQVFASGEQIARISYNGRVWDMNGQEMNLQ